MSAGASRILVLRQRRFVTDAEVNRHLDRMINPLVLAPAAYRLPLDAAAAAREKPLPPGVTNDAKVGLRTDLTPALLDRTEPVCLQRTGYTDGLFTNEVAETVQPERGGAVEAEARAARDGAVTPLPESLLSNHIGAATMALTRDAAFVYQVQGRANIVDPGKLAPSASGSLDWADVEAGAGARQTFRDLIVRGIERELAEEIGADTRAGHCRTILTGYARVLHRGGKPDFLGLTLLRQNAADLETPAHEAPFVGAIHTHPAASLRLADLQSAARALQAAMLEDPRSGYSILLAAAMLVAYLDGLTREGDFIERWFAERD